jgi:threonine/homoserine/homoserine lactone efflux protein
MLTHALIGATYAFAAAVQPGPFQAYLIASTMTRGWRRTAPAVLAPLLSDIPIIAIVLFVLTRVPPAFASLLRLAGGVFLLSLACGAFRTWRDYDAPVRAVGATPVRQTVLNAVMVNLLNPNPYISWSLVLGPVLLEAWRTGTAHALAFLVSFYTTMIATTAAVLVPFAGARSLGPRVGRVLVGLSALALAGFGMYQTWAGARALLNG